MNVVQASAGRGPAASRSVATIVVKTGRRSTSKNSVERRAYPSRRAAGRPARLGGGAVPAADGGVGSVLPHQGGPGDPGPASAAGPQPVLVHLPGPSRRGRGVAVRGRRRRAVRPGRLPGGRDCQDRRLTGCVRGG